jgi:hypothetical protein
MLSSTSRFWVAFWILVAASQLWAQLRHDKPTGPQTDFANSETLSHNNQCVGMFTALENLQDAKHPQWQNHGLVTVGIDLFPGCGHTGPSIAPAVWPAFAHDLHFDFARITGDKSSQSVLLKSRLIEDKAPMWRETDTSGEKLTFHVYGGTYDVEEWKLLIKVSLGGETLSQITLTVPK